MNALDAADIFWEIGTMIGLDKGSKTQKQGFLKLSKLVESLENHWTELPSLKEDDWSTLPKDVRSAFQQLLEHQTIQIHTELQETLGQHAADILRVRGIGPAMARSIQETLDIWTLERLENAAESGELLHVRGIGVKVLEQLKTQIAITQQMLREREDKREQLEALRVSLKDKVLEAFSEPAPENSSTPQGFKTESSKNPAPESSIGSTDTQKADPSIHTSDATESTTTSEEPIRTAVERHTEPTTKTPQQIVFEEVLRSPVSQKTGFQHEGEKLGIPGTSERFPISRTGIIDLLNTSTATDDTLLQKIMETTAYSRLYEEVFRPGFTRVLAQHSVEEDIEMSLEMLSPDPDWGILDVACGTGNYTRAIARRIDPAQGFVVALDVSWSMLRRAALLKERGGFRHVHLVRGDAQELPIADQVLEAVHCTAAFHLIPDPQKALKEFHRVTRTGGKLVLGAFIQSKRFLPLRLLQRYASPIAGMRWFDQSELEACIREAGYRIARTHVDGLAISIEAERL